MKKFTALLICVMLVTTLAFSGCSSTKDVLTIGGEKIPEGWYGYFYGYLYNTYSEYLEESYIQQYTVQQIAQMVAIKQVAEQYDVSLSNDEVKALKTTHKSNIVSMTASAYSAFLKGCGLTDAQYFELEKRYALYDKLYEYLYGENGTELATTEDLYNEYKAEYCHATHILFLTSDTETDAERDEIYAKAEECYQKLQDGADFFEMVKEYGDDPGVAETPEKGYYFTVDSTSMDATFVSTAIALEDNAYSEIVTLTSGYSIIMRLPITDEYLEETFADGTLEQNYYSALLSNKCSELINSMELEVLPAYDTLDMTNAKAVWASSSASNASIQ